MPEGKIFSIAIKKTKSEAITLNVITHYAFHLEKTDSSSKEQEMFTLIAEHESSSMTVKEFYELYDLSISNYYYWTSAIYPSLLNTVVMTITEKLTTINKNTVELRTYLFLRTR